MYSKGGKRKPRALRHLAEQELGLIIQQGQHSSVDDARAALYLYQKHAGVFTHCGTAVLHGLMHKLDYCRMSICLPCTTWS
jgi:hypothetical protein